MKLRNKQKENILGSGVKKENDFSFRYQLFLTSKKKLQRFRIFEPRVKTKNKPNYELEKKILV